MILLPHCLHRPAVLLAAVVLGAMTIPDRAAAVLPAAPSNITISMTRAVDATFLTGANADKWDDNHTYLISWADNSYDEDGFRVEIRGGNAGPFSSLGTVGANTTFITIALQPYPKDLLLQIQVSAYKFNAARVEAAICPVLGEFRVPEATTVFTAPTNMTAENVNDGTVKLKWTDGSSNEVFHQFAYKKQSDSTFSNLGFVNFNTTEQNVLIGLVPGTAYNFRVRATRETSADGNLVPIVTTHYTNWAEVNLTTPVLTAPSGLAAEAIRNALVRLTWTDNSRNETGYQIEYRTVQTGTPPDYTVWGTAGANSTSVNVDQPPRTTLEWRVKAIYQTDGMATALESAATTAVQVTTSFPAVSGLTATTSPQSGFVNLAWQDNSDSETQFVVLTRPLGATNWGTALTVPAGTTSASVNTRTDTGAAAVALALNATHEFAVEARYVSNLGTFSADISNIAQADPKDGFTSRQYQPATMGTAFTYQASTSNLAGRTSWNITGLPAGLVFDNGTGQVTGTPTVTGVFVCPMTAVFNNGWTANDTLTLRILRVPAGPSIVANIPDVTLAPGGNFTIPLGNKFADPESETAVRLATTKGNVDILLYSSLTPQAVANFLAYVNGGDYTGVSFHRSVPGFVVQGGGFTPVASPANELPNAFNTVDVRVSPLNEPGISNVRGTVASAKQGNNPNSATHDFFFSLANNNSGASDSLDNQNGGFTAFGRVAGTGMSIVDSIAALPTGTYTVRVDGATTQLPNFPLDVTGAAPASMDVNQTVRVNSARVIPVLSYSIISNSSAAAVRPTIINGNELRLEGLSVGNSTVTVQVTDLDGNINGQTLDVTVTNGHKAPVITKHPTALALLAGAKATFTVTATGTALTFQWRKDGVNLAGQNAATLVINNVQAANIGSYDVLVGNATTTLTSNAARLDFRAAPDITTQPVEGRLLQVGQALALEIAATGGLAPTISWLRDSKAVTGQTKAQLNIPAVKLTDAGAYQAVATNASGRDTSAASNVVIVDPATVVTTFKPGAKAVLKAAVAGPGLAFQWRFAGANVTDGGRITGAQTGTLTINGLVNGDSGDYTCQIVAPGTLGTATSGIQRLAVVVKPSLSNFTASTGVIGFPYEFTVPYGPEIANTPSGFQFYDMPAGLRGDSKTGRITGTPTVAGLYRYRVIMSNAMGNSNTATGTMTILPLPPAGVGSFLGAIQPNAQLNANKGGRFDMTVLDSGSYSAKITLAATVYNVTGRLTYLPGVFAPQGQVVIPRKDAASLTLAFSMNENTGQLTGQITDGTNTSTVYGFRQFWDAAWKQSSAYSGSFTVPSVATYNLVMNLAAGDVGNVGVPQGACYANVSASRGGTTITSGKLADGTSFTSSSIVGPSGQFFIYQMLYKNTGSIQSTPSFGTTNFGNTERTILRVSGDFRWIKDAQPLAIERSYRAGFGPVTLGLLGRTYIPQPLNTIILDLPDVADNARFDFSQGGLAASSTNPDVIFRLLKSSGGQYPPAGSAQNPGNVRMALYPATGTFSGSFDLVDGATKRPVNFQGLIMQEIPLTPAILYTNGTVAEAEIPGSDAIATGYFLLPQLPAAGPPATTLTTSPILSGKVDLKGSPVLITTQPVSVAVTVGTAASFTVAGSGQGTLTYQWRKAGVNIAGATTATLSFTPTTANNAGNYDVIVSNGSVTTTSNTVTLTVNVPVSSVVASRLPSASSVSEGQSVTFSVTAQGTTPLSYQWRKGGTAITGATGSTYTINPVAPTDDGNYTVLVSNVSSPAGVSSNIVNLAVNAAVSNVVATRTPASSPVANGQVVTFSVTANGASPLSYQWRKNGTNIPSATASSFVINTAASTDDGNYDVIVSNTVTPAGVTSNTVALTVGIPVGNVLASRVPAATALTPGQSVTFSVAAEGDTPLSYQWRKNGTNIPSATSATYTIDSAGVSDSGDFDVLVSNALTPAGVASGIVNLTVAELVTNVVAVRNPATSTVVEGAIITFSVTADGTGPLGYQWRKNGTSIPGATASTYIVNPAALADDGSYDVLVSNAISNGVTAVTSNTVELDVVP